MTRYIYFRNHKTSVKHDGIICVGYRFEKSNEKTSKNFYSLKIALTYCSPNDRFNKNIARKILENRFEHLKYGSITLFKKFSYEEIVKCIIKYLQKFIQDKNKHKQIFGIYPPYWVDKQKIFTQLLDHKPIFKEMPNPTNLDLKSDMFNKIFDCIKNWDINVPEYYEGYCSGNGSHVKLILDAINKKDHGI